MGYRIELEEIESVLRDTPGIADAAVLVVERDGRPDYLVAMVVPADSSKSTPFAETDFGLSRFVRESLAVDFRPTRCHAPLVWFPCTHSRQWSSIDAPCEPC